MKEHLKGSLSVESSDPAVLGFESLPAREVTPAHSCVPPLDVEITALAPGMTDIVVLRDGEPYDRFPLEVLQPVSVELEASGTDLGGGRFCARQGENAVFLPKLFDVNGAVIGFASPGWEWEIDGWFAGETHFNILSVPAGEARVTVRWNELTDTVTIGSGCP